MTSSGDNIKSRGRPATGKGTLIGVRLQPDQLQALDAYIRVGNERDGEQLTRPQAIREILKTVLFV